MLMPLKIKIFSLRDINIKSGELNKIKKLEFYNSKFELEMPMSIHEVFYFKTQKHKRDVIS